MQNGGGCRAKLRSSSIHTSSFPDPGMNNTETVNLNVTVGSCLVPPEGDIWHVQN